MEAWHPQDQGYEMGVLKILRDGSLDSKWGEVGGSFSSLHFESARNERLVQMVVQTHAILLVGHTLPQTHRLAVARIELHDGLMDYGLDEDGKVYHPIPKWTERIEARAEDSGGVALRLWGSRGETAELEVTMRGSMKHTP